MEDLESRVEAILDGCIDPYAGSDCCYSDHIGKYGASSEITRFIEENFVPKERK